MIKRLLTILLAVILVLPCFSGVVLAIEQGAYTGTITVEKAYAAAGKTVMVDVSIADNPGIAGALLTLEYDKTLTLTGCSNGESFAPLDFTAPGEYVSPCNFSWDSLDAVATEDGTILSLTFAVSEDAPENKKLPVEISYRHGDIYDYNLESLNVKVVNGNVTVIDYTPGDVNDDGVVNGKDVTLVRRYIAGGYNVDIKAPAANVNNDGVVNGKDVTLIRRCIAGGYNVELMPEVPDCEHQLEYVPAKEETCTVDGNIEYWHCTECDELFADEEGIESITLEQTVIKAHHIEVIIPAIPATATEPGYTEGLKCSRCGLVLREPVMVEPNGCSITYHLYGGHDYLTVHAEELGLVNTNPNQYDSEKGLELKNLTGVKGYIFDGWYDGEGANGQLIRSIPAGTTGNVDLYARWTAREYTITLDSPDVDIPWAVHETTGTATGAYTVKYTISSGFSLKKLESYGYTFVGWSNDNGFITDLIPQGTTGNMTLHANWTSNRNRATSYDLDAEKPIMIEDNVNGRFLFVYELGILENVPLTVIKNYGNTDGISINDSYTYTDVVDQTTAEEIAEIIAQATTRSSGWTLTDKWEDIYEAVNEEEEVNGKSKTRTDSEGNTTGGDYFVSNSKGGSSYVSSTSGGSSSSCSKVTTQKSTGINTAIDLNAQEYVGVKLGASFGSEISGEVSVPVKFVEVGAGLGLSGGISGELDTAARIEGNIHADRSNYNYTGTYDEQNKSSYYDTTSSKNNTWNSESGYTSSCSTSRDTSVSDYISEQVANRTSYSVANSTGGENSQHVEVGGTDSRSDEYSTSLSITKGTSKTIATTVNRQSSANGYYRLVNAGTVHVFGVVGYDVATESYFTYCYNILDDDTYEYLDFSKEHANFKGDAENAILPFEVPFYVNEYVQAVTERTEGLEFSLDGKVTGYTGTSTQAVLPQYYSAKNGIDQTATAVRVTGFTADTFAGNTNIEKVVLPIYVSEIPDGAFEGCTNLKVVAGFGITKIGKNAFKGCTSLEDFGITWHVTSIGNNAFDGVNSLSVDARNASVADQALACGTKGLILNLGTISDSYNNKTIKVGKDKEYFALLGRGDTHKNLKIDSSASETYLSNMILADNTDTPLKINSDKLTLNRFTVSNAPAFALIMTGEQADLALYGDVILKSKTDNTVLCKDITLSKENQEVQGIVKSYGNVLTCGGYENLNNNSMLTFPDKDKVISISSEDYEKYLTSSRVVFNANGGTLAAGQTEMTVYYGQTFGTLPVPTRANYNFAGWFTDKTGGTQITANTPVTMLGELTLYAHWNPKSFTVTFNANGGSSNTSKTLKFGDSLGTLPTPTKANYNLAGWFTAASGGSQVSASTVPSEAKDITYYAHWSAKSFTVTFNANGGSGTTSKTLKFGDSLGTLPTPTRAHYTFLGWFTAASGGSQVSASTVPSSATNVTYYAHWQMIKYSVKWSNGTGYTISVKRTSSPIAAASTGALSNGATIYYGDVLSITYTAATGYSISSKGATSITVSGNVTSSNIYATATPNSYTYTILYRSVNGTDLGSTTATYKFGTTNTLYAPARTGYNTPGSQTVTWNATSKTITFSYPVTSVDASKLVATGNWWVKDGTRRIWYDVWAGWTNRTSNSVQIRLVWYNMIRAGSWYGYGQYFNATIGGVATGQYTLCTNSTWASSSSSERSVEVVTSYVTVPVSPTTTSINISANWWDNNSKSGSWSETFPIPAY